MGKLDPKAVPESRATRYPRRFQQHGGDVTKRAFRRLGPHAGLTQFGVNLVRVEPGGMSSLRHWHTEEDEFVVMLSGELVLVTDEGEQPLRAGDLAAFPKNVPNGHHVLNRSSGDATFIVVGPNVDGDVAYYSDVDMMVGPGDAPFRTRAGVPYDDVP
jgi:uncharacterized cupin superfamily protein